MLADLPPTLVVMKMDEYDQGRLQTTKKIRRRPKIVRESDRIDVESFIPVDLFISRSLDHLPQYCTACGALELELVQEHKLTCAHCGSPVGDLNDANETNFRNR